MLFVVTCLLPSYFTNPFYPLPPQIKSKTSEGCAYMTSREQTPPQISPAVTPLPFISVSNLVPFHLRVLLQIPREPFPSCSHHPAPLVITTKTLLLLLHAFMNTIIIITSRGYEARNLSIWKSCFFFSFFKIKLENNWGVILLHNFITTIYWVYIIHEYIYISPFRSYLSPPMGYFV